MCVCLSIMVYGGGAFFVFLQNSVCMAWALVYLHHFVSGAQPLSSRAEPEPEQR